MSFKADYVRLNIATPWAYSGTQSRAIQPDSRYVPGD
jgi:hypothetical protein